MEPYKYYQDEFITLYCGDALTVLDQLEPGIVQTCVTSPPYFGLRDYGTATWEGGDPKCDHSMQDWAKDAGNVGPAALRANEAKSIKRSAGKCGKCGAARVDQQIGLEPTPEAFVKTMVEVFDKVRRVLRKDGTLWMNMGDSYNGQGERKPNIQDNGDLSFRSGGNAINIKGLKPKDLCGMPWRTAFALQDAGWWLRQDIIWAKDNPMPESVTDRCTKAHEYIFLMSAAKRYFYDNEAIKEPISPKTLTVSTTPRKGDGTDSFGEKLNKWMDENGGRYHPETRNKRSVWRMAIQPFSEAHFATFPKTLPETCIKAGTSEKGQCSICGKPFERIVEKTTSFESGSGRSGNEINGKGDHALMDATANKKLRKGPVNTTTTVGWSSGKGRDRTAANRNGEGQSTLDSKVPIKETIGWETCCAGSTIEPQIVLDPFAGAGTTLIVAKLLGRKAIGIELNPEYCEMIVRRIKEITIVRPEERGLIVPKVDNEAVLPLFG